MIQKSLLYILTMGLIAIVLTACGGKGIDRTLDYSGTEEELGESYGKAMADATPEQQNILREHQMIVLSVVSLARNSNPATVDAFVAKKNADEFQRLSKMSVRELLVEKLGERQNQLNSIIPGLDKMENGDALKIENISIDHVKSNGVVGVLSMRNDSDDFNFYFRGCQLALVLDGKQVEELHETNDCLEFKTIKNKGGKETFKFDHTIRGERGDENFKKFDDLLKSDQMQKIAWRFKPSHDSYFGSNDKSETFKADGSNFKEKNKELQKITADLAVLKK